MSLVKKKSKLEFKSLDGTMKTVNQHGDRVSTNMKCTELDRVVAESLGVTPAILENVIFCHQEDSSWPMQDPLTLKKKLDDIFESTRYTKALEAFKKSKQEFSLKAKDLKAQQNELAAHMAAADLYLKELADCESNETDCREKLQQFTEQLEKLESKATRFRENLTRLEGSREEVNKMQSKIEDLTRRIRDREQSLEKTYAEPDVQLTALLEDFDEKMKSKDAERKRLQKEVDALNYANNELRQMTDDLNIKRGVTDSLHQHFASVSGKYTDTTRKVCQKYGLQPPVVFDAGAQHNKGYKPVVAKDFLNKLNSKITEMQQDVDNSVSVLKQQVADQEKLVAEIRSSSQRQELELDQRNKDITKTTQEISARQNGLSILAVSKDNLATLERDYEADASQLETLKATNQAKLEEFKAKLRGFAESIRNLTDDYERDKDVLSSLSMRRSEMLQNDAAERQVHVDEEQILADLGVFFRNNAEVLDNAVVPEGPDLLGEVLEKLNRRTLDKRRDLDKKKADSDEMIRKGAASDALIGELQKKLTDERTKAYKYRSVETDFKECTENLKKVMDDFDECPPTLLAEMASPTPSVECVKASLAWVAEQRKMVEGLRVAAQRSQRKANKLKAQNLKTLQDSGNATAQDACPCCAQALNTPALADLVKKNISTMVEHMRVTKEEEEQMNSKVIQAQEIFAALESPIRESKELKERIADLESRIVELENAKNQQNSLLAFTKIKDDLHTLEVTISASEKAYSTLQELKIRWHGIHSRKGECAAKKRSIHSSQFGADTGGRSIEAIELQQTDRMKEKEAAQAGKDLVMKEEADYTKKFYVLNANTQEKEKALQDARKKGEKYADEKKAIEGLQRQLQEAQQAKRDIQSERDATTRDASSRTSDLTEKKNRYEDAQQIGRTKMDEVRTARDQVQQLTEALAETTAKLTSSELSEVVPRIEKATKEVAANEKACDNLRGKISDISTELVNQEHTKRTVRENLELRLLKRDLEDSKAAMSRLRESRGLDEGKFNELARDLQRAEQEKGQVSNHMSTERGKLSIYEQQLRDIQTKLNGPNYKDVKQKHRRKAIEYETTFMAVTDLDSYYNALDKALQNFHTLKIREINKIVRELWQLIYKGQDIDMIQLVSGEDEGAAGAAAPGAKTTTRSYNYRVMMKKGGETQLDMRGRCSAGQRVLASIVIRLALAETFCLNCGILALDEPTTNLDEQNKAGLAHALARIILSRSKQQNFQLIVITHDEEFVKLMSTELAANAEFSLPEYYFRVSREESDEGTGKFFSHIERLNWQNL